MGLPFLVDWPISVLINVNNVGDRPFGALTAVSNLHLEQFVRVDVDSSMLTQSIVISLILQLRPCTGPWDDWTPKRYEALLSSIHN